MFGIPMELLSMAVSTVGGFYLKNSAQNAERLHEERMQNSQSRKDAENRSGVWIRRFIVLVMMSLLMFIVVAPAFLDVNTILIEDGWFGTKQIVVEGVIYDDTIRLIIVSIIGYYFGTSSAQR